MVTHQEQKTKDRFVTWAATQAVGVGLLPDPYPLLCSWLRGAQQHRLFCSHEQDQAAGGHVHRGSVVSTGRGSAGWRLGPITAGSSAAQCSLRDQTTEPG